MPTLVEYLLYPRQPPEGGRWGAHKQEFSLCGIWISKHLDVNQNQVLSNQQITEVE